MPISTETFMIHFEAMVAVQGNPEKVKTILGSVGIMRLKINDEDLKAEPTIFDSNLRQYVEARVRCKMNTVKIVAMSTIIYIALSVSPTPTKTVGGGLPLVVAEREGGLCLYSCY